jgi:hypothetical protein
MVGEGVWSDSQEMGKAECVGLSWRGWMGKGMIL